MNVTIPKIVVAPAPDDLMRALLTKIILLAPPSFIWKEHRKVFSHMLNPTLQYISHGHKLLLAFRKKIYDSPIEFMWYDLDHFQLLQDDYEYGIGLFSHYLTIPSYEFNQLQEDPRLFLRSDGNISITYTGKAHLFSAVKPCYLNLSLLPHLKNLSRPSRNNQEDRRKLFSWKINDPTPEDSEEAIGDKLVHLSDTIMLDDHPYDRNLQKNWVLLEHAQQLYFIQSFNPLHILTLETIDAEKKVGRLKVAYEAPQEIALPWAAEYGLPLRGGTPTILLQNLTRFHTTKCHNHHELHPNDEKDFPLEFADDCFQPPDSLYIAFFHTVSQFKQPVSDTRTYFMGVIALCPHFPFPIYAVSPHPILLEEYYLGTWANPPRMDHVVFPIGLFQLPDDQDHIWMTFGYEDKHGSLGKFHVYDLLRSLEKVQTTCSKG